MRKGDFLQQGELSCKKNVKSALSMDRSQKKEYNKMNVPLISDLIGDKP